MRKQEIKKKQSGITFGYISSWIVVLEIVAILAIITEYGLVTFNALLFVFGMSAMMLSGHLFDLIEDKRKSR